MTSTLRERAPSARCYRCGSLSIHAVCHTCGEAACVRHAKAPTDKSNRPVTKEFLLTLGPTSKPPYHCDKHEHVVRGRLTRFVWAGGGAAVLGVVVMTFTVTVGLVLLLCGLAVGGVAVWLDMRRRESLRASRPPLPLTPGVEAFRIDEKVEGTLLLDSDGRYLTTVDAIIGKLAFTATVGKNDRDRLVKYRMNYGVPPAEDVEFSAGFAVLEGSMGLDFGNGQGDNPVIPLTGKISEIPFFDASAGRPTGQWQVRRDYEIKKANRIEELPIWLTPSVRAGSDRRNLELELRWVDFLPEDVELEVEHITKFVVHVPHTWGHVESVNVDDSIIGESGGYIELRRPKLEDGRLRLSVQFEKQIAMSDTITGELDIVFRNTLSGVRGVKIHHPLGHQRDIDEKKIESRITLTATFELSLAGIRYQDSRVENAEIETFPGVIPDYDTVIELTNALSADNYYYVKGVIENPPRSGARASVVNRAWDISGRRYDGVYPVDFHIVLTGEELHRGDIRAHSGTTTMRMNVQGTFANDEMKELIGQERDALHDLVKNTLENRAPSGPLSDAVDSDRPPTDANGQRTDARPSGDGGRSRRRRDEALDALLAGRISEQTYHAIVRRIDEDEDSIR